MCQCRSLSVLLGPLRLYGFLYVFIGLNASLWFPLVRYVSLWVCMDPCMSLCVLMGPKNYGSFLACLHVHFWEPVPGSEK